jgi:hypothetical protein
MQQNVSAYIFHFWTAAVNWRQNWASKKYVLSSGTQEGMAFWFVHGLSEEVQSSPPSSNLPFAAVAASKR